MYFSGDAHIKRQSANAANISGRCAQCSVRDTAICSSLSQDDLSALEKIGRRRTLSKNQSLAWEGDTATLIANVLSGMLEIFVNGPNGSEQIVGLVGPGGFAGYAHDRKVRHNIKALVETELCIFPIDSFDRFAEVHPEIQTTMLHRSLDELDRMRRWMLLLGRGSAAERVATLLLSFAGENTGRHPLQLSRGQIAEFTGLTIETVSRQFTQLKSADVITLPTRNSFEVIDRDALLAISGINPDHMLH